MKKNFYIKKLNFILLLLVISYTNVYAENIQIDSFKPKEVFVGSNVEIRGKNFIGIEKLLINNVEISSSLYRPINLNGVGSIILNIPENTTSGKIKLITKEYGVTESSESLLVKPKPTPEEVKQYSKELSEVVDPSKNKNVIKSDNIYTFLAPIGEIKCMDNTGQDKECISNDIGEYLGFIFRFLIGVAAALAIIMLIIAGITYMGDESVFGKTEAKNKMFKAVLGLLIALGSYALLNTINPDLTGSKGFTVDKVEIEVEGDVNAPVNLKAAELTSLGIICKKEGGVNSIPSVAKSFKDKMTYSQYIPKGTLTDDNKVRFDCSGYVNAVLSCVGVDINSKGINSGTSIIFSHKNSEKIVDSSNTQVNGVDLKVGDLVGWKPSDDKSGNGHIMIYIGGGKFADSHGPKNKSGLAYGEFSLDKYKDRIKYILRYNKL